jgi:hypothetical protein
MTLIVKAMAWDNLTASSANVNTSLWNSALSLQVRLSSVTINAGAQLSLEFWHVLNPGDQLLAFSSEAGVTYWISGAALQGDSPFTPVGPLLKED